MMPRESVAGDGSGVNLQKMASGQSGYHAGCLG